MTKHMKFDWQVGSAGLACYFVDPIVLDIVLGTGLMFHVHSEEQADVCYNIYLDKHYCDCPTLMSSCKNILGVKLFLQNYFPHLLEHHNQIHRAEGGKSLHRIHEQWMSFKSQKVMKIE